jgi:hypothetical protein
VMTFTSARTPPWACCNATIRSRPSQSSKIAWTSAASAVISRTVGYDSSGANAVAIRDVLPILGVGWAARDLTRRPRRPRPLRPAARSSNRHRHDRPQW